MKNTLKSLQLFNQGDKIVIRKIQIDGKDRESLAGLGVCEGSVAEIFFINRHTVVLRLGKTKLALCANASERIWADRFY